MRTIIRNLMAAIILLAASLQTHAQGTLVYDQQSTNPPSPLGDYLNIQEDQPVQSFVPALSVIGFVQFEFWDIANNGTNGATVYVDLWTGSPIPDTPSATLLGSTAPVYMPNGFNNDNLVSAGVTNFYFSTPITLTRGQTYYLEPVVLSGDNPWDIWAPGDTYPNGQLFEDGDAFNADDLWFREGIVSVPEPTTLALVGLSCLLAFGFKRRSKLIVLSWVGVLFMAPVLSVYSAQDSVVQATADAAGLTPVSAAALPDNGTFWVMTIGPDGDLIELPDPFLPPSLSGSPIYSVTNDIFIVDDTGGQLAPSSAGRMSEAQATSAAQAQAATTAALIEQILYPTNNGGETDELLQPDGLMIDTNGLWLESSNEDTYLGLRLHNPTGDNYQLLSATNLSNTNWDLGQILFGVSGDYADFTPVPMTNATTFFRVHQASPVMVILDNGDSEELDPTNTGNPGYPGSLYVENEWYPATNDVTVYYSIGGTAQNGVDYSNLTGAVTIPANQYSALIGIDPTADGLKPNQTIILTLLQNTNYLIDPAYDSATNILTANPQVYPIADGDNEQICPNSTNNITLQASDPHGLPLTFSILTYPAHGTLTYVTNENYGSEVTNVTYIPNSCYEGQDSFTFEASDGQYVSTPATVTLIISNSLYASPVTAQTCRGTPVGFYLNGGDNCGGAYYEVSTPLDGTVSNVSGGYYIYTPDDTNFTGTDTFNYTVYDSCGDSVMSIVTITVGDAGLYSNPQSVTTGTNEPAAIALSVMDYGDICEDDTNDYTYTLISGPTNGTLTGTPPNLTYTPNANYEGMDSFQLNVNDGVWTSSYPATVTIYTVAGPILTAECDPFGTAPLLDWSLDTNVLQMTQQDDLYLIDFIVYRSAVSGGPYTAIATNSPSQMNYFDTNAVPGQTNYYVVTFESSESGITYVLRAAVPS